MTCNEPTTCPHVPCHRLMTSSDRFQQTPAIENGGMEIVNFKMIESFDGNSKIGE